MTVASLTYLSPPHTHYPTPHQIPHLVPTYPTPYPHTPTTYPLIPSHTHFTPPHTHYLSIPYPHTYPIPVVVLILAAPESSDHPLQRAHKVRQHSEPLHILCSCLTVLQQTSRTGEVGLQGEGGRPNMLLAELVVGVIGLILLASALRQLSFLQAAILEKCKGKVSP